MTLPQRSSPQPLPPQRRSSSMGKHRLRRTSSNIAQQAYQEKATEILMMMAVNGAIALVAALALIKLIPYNASQQTKLRSLEAEVNTLDQRVDHLRQEFTNNFDPQQSRSNMRILGDRLEQDQREIIFIPTPTEAASSEQLESEQLESEHSKPDPGEANIASPDSALEGPGQ